MGLGLGLGAFGALGFFGLGGGLGFFGLEVSSSVSPVSLFTRSNPLFLKLNRIWPFSSTM